MIDPEEALRILKKEGCSPEVLDHVKAVRDVSLEIAKSIEQDGNDVDIDLVKVGAILHDVGRSKTHDVNHGVEGAEILNERGLEKVASIAETHVGAGISKEETKNLNLPEKNLIPTSLEEKIVAYGDNLIVGNKTQTYEEALEEMREELGSNHSSIERFKKIHQELEELGAFKYSKNFD